MNAPTVYDSAYKKGLTGANITNAIAEYEKTLITTNSRFDQYLEGNLSALTPEEIEGFKLFLKTGCQTCHVGQSMGGQSYEKMGVYLMGVKPRHSWRGCKSLPQSGNNMIDPYENWW